eukprot:366260-Chlamydomonas_euryale.AAC.46
MCATCSLACRVPADTQARANVLVSLLLGGGGIFHPPVPEIPPLPHAFTVSSLPCCQPFVSCPSTHPILPPPRSPASFSLSGHPVLPLVHHPIPPLFGHHSYSLAGHCLILSLHVSVLDPPSSLSSIPSSSKQTPTPSFLAFPFLPAVPASLSSQRLLYLTDWRPSRPHLARRPGGDRLRAAGACLRRRMCLAREARVGAPSAQARRLCLRFARSQHREHGH